MKKLTITFLLSSVVGLNAGETSLQQLFSNSNGITRQMQAEASKRAVARFVVGTDAKIRQAACALKDAALKAKDVAEQVRAAEEGTFIRPAVSAAYAFAGTTILIRALSVWGTYLLNK